MTVPDEKLAELKSTLEERCDVRNVFRKLGKGGYHLVIFHVSTVMSGPVIKTLEEGGFGIKYGTIDVLPIVTCVPPFHSSKTVTKKSSKASVPVEELYSGIFNSSRPSISFLIMSFISFSIAAIALLKNSSVHIIAAMVLGPMMGPILGLSFGVVTRDRKLVKIGIFSELIALGIGLSIGLAFGLANFLSGAPIFTDIMSSYGTVTFYDLIVPLLTGIVVGFSLSSDQQSNLIGAAVSSTFEPPCVNFGLVLSAGRFDLVFGSLFLLAVNVFFLNIGAITVFYFKRYRKVVAISSSWEGPHFVIDEMPPPGPSSTPPKTESKKANSLIDRLRRGKLR